MIWVTAGAYGPSRPPLRICRPGWLWRRAGACRWRANFPSKVSIQYSTSTHTYSHLFELATCIGTVIRFSANQYPKWLPKMVVAATRAAKKSADEVQHKLQAMETAVIRLTQEKDALAHRMKVGLSDCSSTELYAACMVINYQHVPLSPSRSSEPSMAHEIAHVEMRSSDPT